jgi:hypothetical protein
MSEYHFVHFLAIDWPLDEKQLDFTGRRSSRTEITQWNFTNEYHYGGNRLPGTAGRLTTLRNSGWPV